jgi:hypothetical protein
MSGGAITATTVTEIERSTGRVIRSQTWTVGDGGGAGTTAPDGEVRLPAKLANLLFWWVVSRGDDLPDTGVPDSWWPTARALLGQAAGINPQPPDVFLELTRAETAAVADALAQLVHLGGAARADRSLLDMPALEAVLRRAAGELSDDM